MAVAVILPASRPYLAAGRRATILGTLRKRTNAEHTRCGQVMIRNQRSLRGRCNE
jgi:hypothetical protein